MQSFAYVGSWVCAGEGREHGFDSSISAVRSSTHKAERQKWIPLLSCRRFFFFALLDARPTIDSSAYPTARSVVRRAELAMA